MRKTFALLVCLGPLLAAPSAKADSGLFHVVPSLGLASPCDDSGCLYTWSLATRLGQALSFAEARYGPRNKAWTILGTEFVSKGHPSVWYPSSDGEFGSIVIQLTASAAREEVRALFQLAHEVIHILDPAGPSARASILEEGLATLNSVEFLQSLGMSQGRDDPRFEAAYLAVLELRRQSGDLEAGVRRLRQSAGGLSGISAQDIEDAFPGVSPPLAGLLATNFLR